MKCSLCGSEHEVEFPAEIAIHYRELENIDKPHVLVFPKLRICPQCGSAMFNVPDTQLRLLLNNGSASAAKPPQIKDRPKESKSAKHKN